MHRGGAPYRGRPCFGEPKVADFPRPNEFGHGADRLLNRDLRIDTMLIIQVDNIDLQPAQARVTGCAHVFGIAANAEELAAGTADVTELGGEYHLLPATGDGATNQVLVAARAVHVRRIQKITAPVQVPVNDRNRLGVIHLTRLVELAHAHAPEPDFAYPKPAAPKFAHVERRLLLIGHSGLRATLTALQPDVRLRRSSRLGRQYSRKPTPAARPG